MQTSSGGEWFGYHDTVILGARVIRVDRKSIELIEDRAQDLPAHLPIDLDRIT